MDKLIAPVAKISLEKGKTLLTGLEISPYKHSQLASQVAGMKVQRYHRKLFLYMRSRYICYRKRIVTVP
jgi:hypothetical protein